jgi:glycosyltransferase involved in cell wall biosynthesis
VAGSPGTLVAPWVFGFQSVRFSSERPSPLLPSAKVQMLPSRPKEAHDVSGPPNPGYCDPPRVSVGIPVFNGERFLAQALESILSQTFRDFELIISDNASTDSTEEICRSYAARDGRIRYHRSERNRGAAWNHNRLVELARAPYFKWQCHDDYCAPTFLESCIAVIDNDPGVVLCYPQFVRVDEQGRRLGVKSSRVVGEGEPRERFRSLIYRRDSCEEIYGVMRSAVIVKTRLIGPYSNSDDTFLAELILHGRFREVPEPLFFYRIHRSQSTSAYPTRSARMAWFDPSTRARLSFPFLRLCGGYISLVWRSPVTWGEKLSCYSSLIGWLRSFLGWLREDFAAARAELFHGRLVPLLKEYAPWTRPIWHRIKGIAACWLRNESAGAREKRLQRERRERWELNPED